MACPDSDVIWQAKEFLDGVVEALSAAVGKVAAGSTNVGMEERVAAEDIICAPNVSMISPILI